MATDLAATSTGLSDGHRSKAADADELPTGLEWTTTSCGTACTKNTWSMRSPESTWELSEKIRMERSENSSMSGTSPTAKELLTEVDPEILRGVRLDVALQGLGRHLHPPDSGMFHVDPKNYALSRKTAKFHAFLSHDWASSRWMKVIALLIAFNARAASITTTIVSVLTGLLCAFGVFPFGMWIAGLPHATFWLVFLFWQRIRSFVGFPVVVFLDKLCIAQHDENLKEKGVLGLAAFLNRSDELTILWSKRYFRRLWCSFELATFMKDSGKHAHIRLVPLKMGVLMALMSQIQVIAAALFYVSLDAESGHRCPIVVGSLAAAAVVAIFPALNYIGIGLMQELEELPRQVCNFRVQQCECFCCSNHHRHPDTGAEIHCDRAAVGQMLQQWFGRPGDVGEEHCRRFNRLVRDRLGPQILGSVGSDALPISYMLYVVCCSNVPWLSTVIVRIAAGPAEAAGIDSLFWGLRMFLEWAQLCLAALCVVRVSLLLWKQGRNIQGQRKRFLASIAMVVPIVATGMATFWSFVLVYDATPDNSMLPAIPFIVVLVIDVYLYWPPSVQVRDLERTPVTLPAVSEAGDISPGSPCSLENDTIFSPTCEDNVFSSEQKGAVLNISMKNCRDLDHRLDVKTLKRYLGTDTGLHDCEQDHFSV
ncbi:hypothetical protein AK812_SmicGene24068 [Symbiodinium microadriaticum]|uniref:Uncharacterized protein n=1 Tax=Symbiodinium microadriaticum TaxID=2951 RepID=A0A1Q9DFM7_SYMMI|nr:hypothetical protein AK812_SmicGene24068 [Symbiodinium microadriaticum]CAE7276721.1 unnamed protein product [Symbiodinium microadriaticum]CAE7945880.1 unnamed protein product [Symbiodinium sp. KB8]